MVKRKVTISIFFFLGNQTERERPVIGQWGGGEGLSSEMRSSTTAPQPAGEERWAPIIEFSEMSSDFEVCVREFSFWLYFKVWKFWGISFIKGCDRVALKNVWTLKGKFTRESNVFLKLMSGCIRFILRVLVIVSPHFSKPSKKVSQKRLSFWANFVPSIWSLIITLRHIRIQ